MSVSSVLLNPTLEGCKIRKRANTMEHGREKRRSVADDSRKRARNIILDNKRRIPLEDLNENVTGRRNKKQTSSDERKEKLRKWREEKQMKKALMHDKFKKTFVVKHVVHSPARFLTAGKCTRIPQQPQRRMTLRSRKGQDPVPTCLRTPDTFMQHVSSQKILPTSQDGKTEIEEKETFEENSFSKFAPTQQMAMVIGNFNFLSNANESDPIAAFNNTLTEDQKRTSFVSITRDSEGSHCNARMSNENTVLEGKSPIVSELQSDFAQEKENASKKFRNIVQEESDKLIALCDYWESILSSEDVPESAQGDIRSTIGQARLLMDQRFGQFNGLIDLHENKTGEKETRASDLEGFWEVIYFQVEDVHKKFADIEIRKERNWTELVEGKRKRGRKTVKASAESKTNLAAANKRKNNFQKFKAEMKAKMEASKDGGNQGSMGFINVLTPMKKRKSVVPDEVVSQNIVLTSVRRSTRKRKSIVPELEFSEEPTYVLPANVFEDCLRSSSSEWPIAILDETEEMEEEKSSSPYPLETNSNETESSPACVKGFSLLRLASPREHNFIKGEKATSNLNIRAESENQKDSPVSFCYLKPSLQSPGLSESGQLS